MIYVYMLVASNFHRQWENFKLSWLSDLVLLKTVERLFLGGWRTGVMYVTAQQKHVATFTPQSRTDCLGPHLTSPRVYGRALDDYQHYGPVFSIELKHTST